MNRESQLWLASHAWLRAMVSTALQAQVVQQYEYKPDQHLSGADRLGITTQIELSPNEKILDYSTGFSAGWELTRRDNVFYLKPKNVDVDTNMMIRTATHSYIFELKVVATDWKTLDQARQAGVQYKIEFTYPADTELRRTKTRQLQTPRIEHRAGQGPQLQLQLRLCDPQQSGPGWFRPTSTTTVSSPT